MPNDIYLLRINPARNERRYYHLWVASDLFGRTCLFRVNGRLGTGGRTLMWSFDNPAEAEGRMATLAAQKVKRGYVLKE